MSQWLENRVYLSIGICQRQRICCVFPSTHGINANALSTESFGRNESITQLQ